MEYILCIRVLGPKGYVVDSLEVLGSSQYKGPNNSCQHDFAVLLRYMLL